MPEPSEFQPRRRIDDHQVIAHFELEELLGSGGQGEVYSARDTKLNRPVALKLMSRRLGFLDLFSEGRTKARFAREAEATAKLDHPGVCCIFEYGVEDGIAWIAMQRIEGESLQSLVAKQRDQGSAEFTLFGMRSRPGKEALTVATKPKEAGLREDDSTQSPNALTMSRVEIDAILRLIESAARAVAAANERGLVHRDLKPGNIMVTADQKAVILDFGLALDEDTDEPNLTLTGDVVGTPAYMSPEQLQGDRAKVDRRTDVYSLGVTLYECLSLSRPFEGFSRVQLFQKILESDPTPIRKLNHRIPRDVEVVLETALQKDPAQRYRSCSEFADELSRITNREPIIARPASTTTKVLRWTQRNPELALFSTLAFLFLIVAVALTSSKNRDLRALVESLAEARSKTSEESRAKSIALEAQAEAAQESRRLVREYERMADLKRVADAEQEAGMLWPLTTKSEPSLKSWLTEHQPLRTRLQEHSKALDKLRSQAVKRPAITSQDSATWDFGDDVETQFRHDSLSELVERLGNFCEARDGAVRSVEERRRVAKTIRTIDAKWLSESWRKATQRIGLNSLYKGIDFRRREGLIPLGPDPESSLEEFLHWPSHAWRNNAAEIPKRGANGRLQLPEVRGMVLALCPPGRSWIGAQGYSPDQPNFDPDAHKFSEFPLAEVELEAFFISKFELTQEQWFRLAADDPSYYKVGTVLGEPWLEPVSMLHPVESLSQSKARRVLQRFGLELPTECQWEYAFRANTKGRFAGPKSVKNLGKYANLAGAEVKGVLGEPDERFSDRHAIHAPVGSYRANEFGLYDMMGNVMELCRGPWTVLDSPPQGPEGIRKHVGHQTVPIRGGAFLNNAYYGRASFRREINPSATEQYLGVRAILRRGLVKED